jgi:L-asparaginase II
MPRDAEERASLRAQDTTPCQWHNNCSGKHAGFLTLNKHLGGGADYHQPDHLVQQACLTAFEDTTGQDTLGYGIDGCSAPNFATTVHGLARAMAWFASAADRNDVASNAASDLDAGDVCLSRIGCGRRAGLYRIDARHGWPRRD